MNLHMSMTVKKAIYNNVLKALTGLPGKLDSKPQSHMKVTRFSHVLEYMKLTLPQLVFQQL